MSDEVDDEDVSIAPLPDRSPKQIERSVLSISNASSKDELCAALDASDWLVARSKSIQAMCRQIAVSWIEENGEFTIGGVKYAVGYHSTTRCLDTRRCGHSILEVLAGDFDRFLDALCSQPFKHGHVRSILDKPSYRSLFHTKTTGRLINGVPERTLVRQSTRFG